MTTSEKITREVDRICLEMLGEMSDPPKWVTEEIERLRRVLGTTS